MSQENVEAVRSAVEAFAQEDLETTFRDAAPDFQLDISRAIGSGGTAIGEQRGILSLDRARGLAETFTTSWAAHEHHPGEFIDAGEHVVTPFTHHLRAPIGAKVHARGTWLWTLRDGAIVRLSLYRDREEALEAAGLRE
jgi:ketosteroid isomerase-like protein